MKLSRKEKDSVLVPSLCLVGGLVMSLPAGQQSVMDVSETWQPARGMDVEVLFSYPILGGSFQHTCWKGGKVVNTAELEGQQSAQVELTVVGRLAPQSSCLQARSQQSFGFNMLLPVRLS
jgi:hypothetical protein